MLISDGGTLVRTVVKDVSVTGRNTQGVTLIKLGKGELLTQVERIAKMAGEDDEELLDEEGNVIEEAKPEEGVDAPAENSSDESEQPTDTED